MAKKNCTPETHEKLANLYRLILDLTKQVSDTNLEDEKSLIDPDAHFYSYLTNDIKRTRASKQMFRAMLLEKINSDNLTASKLGNILDAAFALINELGFSDAAELLGKDALEGDN